MLLVIEERYFYFRKFIQKLVVLTKKNIMWVDLFINQSNYPK